MAKVFGYCCDNSILTIVMEYMPTGIFLCMERERREKGGKKEVERKEEEGRSEEGGSRR